MAQECKDIVIEHAIMHRLDADKAGRRLVRTELPLQGAALELVTPLVVAALDCSQIFAIDRKGESTALAACWHMLASPEAFVPRTTELANSLNGLMEQNDRISKGDLVVVLAKDSVGRFVAVLKLGKFLQFEPEYLAPKEDGTWEISIRRNEDAVSPDSKPQKCAIIREPAADRGYHVQLHDEQINKRQIAKFFHRDFLGCELLSTKAQLTLNFCIEAESWRRKHAAYLERQGIVSFTLAFRQHLASPVVDFDAFAESAITGSNNYEWFRENLATYLQAKLYSDEHEEKRTFFEPDPDAAQKALSTMNFTLGGGVKLSGPADELLSVITSADLDGDDKLTFRITTTSIEQNFRI